MKHTNFDIADVIKRIRKEQKLSQRVFAEKLGVNIKTVQNWEYKYTLPTRANIQTVIDTFNLKKEDYPELFEYISHPNSYSKADEAKESVAAEPIEQNADGKNDDENKSSPHKKLFNMPIKIVLVSLLALFALVGIGLTVYMTYIGISHGMSIEVCIIALCILVATIAVPLFVYFLIIKRRKK